MLYIVFFRSPRNPTLPRSHLLYLHFYKVIVQHVETPELTMEIPGLQP